jgi:hypothetical protein
VSALSLQLRAHLIRSLTAYHTPNFCSKIVMRDWYMFIEDHTQLPVGLVPADDLNTWWQGGFWGVQRRQLLLSSSLLLPLGKWRASVPKSNFSRKTRSHSSRVASPNLQVLATIQKFL